MQSPPSKISQIKTAGLSIEKANASPGFTVMDLVDALNWDTPQDKFYIQSTMTALVRKGEAFKRTHTKPAVYTFQKKAKAPTKQSQKKSKLPAGQAAVQPVRNESPTIDLGDASVDDFKRLGVTPDMLGKAVFRVFHALQRQVFDLEDELAQTKRKLDDANKRISEQNAMIERRNQAVAGGGLKQQSGKGYLPNNKPQIRPGLPHKPKRPTVVQIRKQG